jgi:hypothetical protein
MLLVFSMFEYLSRFSSFSVLLFLQFTERIMLFLGAWLVSLPEAKTLKRE